MSLIESRDILNKLCSNDYYRGDDVQCAIQCLAEGKAINRVRTLEDVGQTVIDEKLKDRLMKSKDKGNAFDDVNWAWLLSLLLFLSTLEPPKRREITISAKSNSKSVTITYDPSDAEAVKAAEVWRKALFADKAQYEAVAPVAVKTGDVATFTEHLESALDELLKRIRREGYCCPSCGRDNLRKAAEPLRDYLKAHGDPHTSVIVTQDGATETQDERRVTFDSEKPAGTAKHEPATPERIADTDNYKTLKALVENTLTALNRAATEVSRKSEYDKGFHTGALFAISLLKESNEDLARWHRECQTRKRGKE